MWIIVPTFEQWETFCYFSIVQGVLCVSTQRVIRTSRQDAYLPCKTFSSPRQSRSMVITSSATKYGTTTMLWSLNPKLTSRDKWLNTDLDNFLRRQVSPPVAGYRTAWESLRHRSQTSRGWLVNRTPQQRQQQVLMLSRCSTTDQRLGKTLGRRWTRHPRHAYPFHSEKTSAVGHDCGCNTDSKITRFTRFPTHICKLELWAWL